MNSEDKKLLQVMNLYIAGHAEQLKETLKEEEYKDLLKWEASESLKLESTDGEAFTLARNATIFSFFLKHTTKKTYSVILSSSQAAHYINEKNENLLFSLAELHEDPIILSLCRKLIKNGASVNLKSDRDGTTALHNSVSCENYQLSKLLLSSGADPNLQEENGETPLYYACVNDTTNIISLLLAYGADPQIADNDGVKPLDSINSEQLRNAVRLRIANNNAGHNDDIIEHLEKIIDERNKPHSTEMTKDIEDNERKRRRVGLGTDSDASSFESEEDIKPYLWAKQITPEAQRSPASDSQARHL